MIHRAPRTGDDGGWVLLTSIVMLSLMVMLAMTLLSIVGVQTRASGDQRLRETSFNLAEAGLNAQLFSLSRDWPGYGAAANPYPNCSAQVISPRCPGDAQITGLMPSADTTGATWQTVVRDNGAAGSDSFYSDALVLGQPAYDANKDGKLWVRSTATAKGKTRTIVALVRAEGQEEDIYHGALLTGRLDISNMGNKPILDASAGGGVATATVRCTPQLLAATPCLGHQIGSGSLLTLADLTAYLGQQLTPNVTQTGYTGGPAMSVDARARLKATAIADGTYYTGCPPSLAGHVVYIEAGTCSYTGNEDINSDAVPGVVIMATGSLYLGGTETFHGVIYHANLLGSSGVAVQVQGNAMVVGGLLVDGDATTVAGSSGLNIQLAPGAFGAVTSYGSAGVIQNTWREIRAS